MVFQAKYKECKEKWSFCIPGFQVYDLLNSTLGHPRKYDKEFGKSLDPGKVISGKILYKQFNTYFYFIYTLYILLIFQYSRHFLTLTVDI